MTLNDILWKFTTMNVLVVGSGGREHALVWRLLRCPSVERVVAAPGNAGITRDAECAAVSADDLDGMVRLAVSLPADLVVVGPELPLTMGLADLLRASAIPCFGPGADGARLEGSKAWAKEVMEEAGIPTAAYRTFTEMEAALSWLAEGEGPIVVKASGLAAGKGAIVAEDRGAAELAVRRMMEEGAFGEAGRTVVIEEYMEGEEASILAVTDGKGILTLVPSQDHKRVRDGDTGPNTGGMGAYAPAPVVDASVLRKVQEQVLQPLLRTLRARGIDYRGVLYAGLMIGPAGEPRVVEFNCRFGDPEAQVVLPLITGDLAEALLAAAEGRLEPDMLGTAPGAAVCVIMASGGYPEAYRQGHPIEGLEDMGALAGPDGAGELVVFHAGTALREGAVVTAGGRVLGITAVAADVGTAAERAYQGVERIRFDGAHYRTDIAYRALRSARTG